MFDPRSPTADGAPSDAVARLADLVRAERTAILTAWTRRVDRLPASDTPSLVPEGDGLIAWIARALADPSRADSPGDGLVGRFGGQRAIVELALLTDAIDRLGPVPLDDAARDALHVVVDGAIARSRAREADEAERLRTRLRLATDLTLVGCWELDPRTGLVRADTRARELFGVPDTAATVDALTSSLHADDRDRVRESLSTGLGSDRRTRAECRAIRNVEGSYRWIALAAEVYQSPGATRTLLGIVHDISDQKRAEEEHARVVVELSRAVHMSEMFVGILSHDLRNPLSAILSGANLLGRELQTEKSGRVLSRVVSSGERMGRMIDQLLDFTRVRLGEGIPLARTAMDLAELVREVVEEARVSRPAAVLHLMEQGDTTGAWDRDRLSQVVSNLLGNALQHGEPGAGGIEIVLDGSNPAHVTLAIHNPGAIPVDLLSVLFDPFRGTVHKLGKSSGLGLGLYVARQVAVAHGGELAVESPPTGTVIFRLRLPRSAPSARPSPVVLVGDEELAAFARMAAPIGTTAVTARLFGATPLALRAPLEHADIVRQYGNLLESALKRKVYRGQGESLARDLNALADRLGELGAGPRELTEVHAEALRQTLRGANSSKTLALISEGRLLALELMGHLASYYRRRYRGQPRASGAERAGNPTS